MFRFWTADARATDAPAQSGHRQMSPDDNFSPAHAVSRAAGAPSALTELKLKRKRSIGTDAAMPPSPTTLRDAQPADPLLFPASKRIKSELDDTRPRVLADNSLLAPYERAKESSVYIASPPSSPILSTATPSATDNVDIDHVKEIVQYEFGHEILMKHNELRLIEQEMAKCQIALEQLRRCHLIPYPTACPTPEQMLDIASGRGTAVRPRPGAAVAKWAAPFGVVDGPYARHYAKWLIPDPVFDGPLPNWPGVASSARSKSAATAEARATRNSIPDSKGRPSRAMGGQRLHSLSSGYPQPKDKAGPCVLKRADGKVVKLVCIDCHRENFSSTQGFINHCRIAHKRDFKSHEEAAVHCGHPIDPETAPAKKIDAPVPAPTAAASPAVAGVPVSVLSSAAAVAAVVVPGPALSFSAPAPTATIPGHVYPLARSDSDAVNSLLQHLNSTMKKCSAAATASSNKTASTAGKAMPEQLSASFVGSDKTPFLTRLLQEKNFVGNLHERVEDAKEVMDLDDGLWYSDVADEFTPESTATPAPATVKRMPARQTASDVFVSNVDGADCSVVAVPQHSNSTTVSSHVAFGAANVCTALSFNKNGARNSGSQMFVDDEMDVDVDLSPNPSTSNNAPSLVSDDGEYDDSDDGSDSETSNTDLESLTDVPEITTDDEDRTHDASRPLGHHHTGAGTAAAMKLKKEEGKHVAYVKPVTGNGNVKQ